MKEIQNFNGKGNENILTLVYENEKGVDITTSLIVAKVFGKRNSDVLRDVRNLNCSNDFRERNFALMVEMRQLPQGGAQKTEYYTMTKDGFSFLVMGYTGEKAGEFKERFINEFNKREAMLKSDDYILMRSMQILQGRISAIEEDNKRLLAENQQKQIVIEAKTEENNILNDTVKRQAPMVEYVNTTLLSPRTYTSTQLAKELGLRTANELHKKLKEWGVMYYQSGQWMLTAKYCGKDYTKPRTQSGVDDYGKQWSNTITVWTETGRMFLHALFKQKIAG
ncbi:phage regulatory protein/antirepressor Ant [Phocaeicola plebeius]|jgi:Rha family phage regulatory protein|uniref:phage regulatory protein/antirepressor Ant n=1 Tax=Phocaeicola plebeius TaxID=310297 RepID=UPI002062C3D5|nr:phage regulatory protein/antirepressor Ant [Phocaeicola plebeius]DAP45489.1 MAG TPA: regulatory protein [Caudoviricetes sp.]